MTPYGLFDIREKDLAGRIARLHTPHGIIETPALLPVIDIVRQEVPIEDIKRLGFNAVITNAYLLWKRMRTTSLEKGVHKVLGFDGTVMTDSGAYQILQYGEVDIDPIEVIKFQQGIGSDIAVILDIPTGNARDRKQAEYSVAETLRRAKEALKYIDPENRIWVLPIQGGPFSDLVAKSATEARALEGYKLYALGSPTVLLERYEYRTLLEMIYTARTRLPITRPLHLFGAGHPMIIPFAVALGVDLFDSASYILYARDERYMTPHRTYRLRDLEYFPCSCPVCTKYTPKELLEMSKQERVRLLALHNLHVLRQTINEVKVAIKEGRLWELLEERSRAHPSLSIAFAEFKKYSSFIEKLSPRVKASGVKGVFLYGPESLYNPKILHHHQHILRRYKPRKHGTLLLIPVDPSEKPFTRSKIYTKLRKQEPSNTHIAGYMLYIGIIPEELSETYPLSQFEANTYTYQEVIDKTAKIIINYIENNKENYTAIKILTCREWEWSKELAAKIMEKLGNKHTIDIREENCERTFQSHI